MRAGRLRSRLLLLGSVLRKYARAHMPAERAPERARIKTPIDFFVAVINAPEQREENHERPPLFVGALFWRRPPGCARRRARRTLVE